MNTISDELIMIVPENLLLKAPAGFNFPLKYDGIGEIVDAQPGRETPVEWLSIDKIESSLAFVDSWR